MQILIKWTLPHSCFQRVSGVKTESIFDYLTLAWSRDIPALWAVWLCMSVPSLFFPCKVIQPRAVAPCSPVKYASPSKAAIQSSCESTSAPTNLYPVKDKCVNIYCYKQTLSCKICLCLWSNYFLYRSLLWYIAYVITLNSCIFSLQNQNTHLNNLTGGSLNHRLKFWAYSICVGIRGSHPGALYCPTGDGPSSDHHGQYHPILVVSCIAIFFFWKNNILSIYNPELKQS